MTNCKADQLPKWIKCEDKLPPKGKYVLGRHNRGTWHDDTDQVNVNCVIVKLKKGISKKERKEMKKNNLPWPINTTTRINDNDINKIRDTVRSRTYKREDEDDNNLKPYCWEEFGPDWFFGQDIYKWTYIPAED